MTGISFRDYWNMGRARGWRYPVKYFVQSHLFDIVRGTNTHYWVPPDEYDRTHPAASDAVHYVACPTRAIKRCLDEIGAHAGVRLPDFQFVDLGCGKGKTLLVYAEHVERGAWPAVGIELMPQLVRIAQDNVKARGLGDRIKVVQSDATAWRSHCARAPTILFLYNPFGAETLARALRAADGLECYVAYVDPEHSAVLAYLGWARTFRATGRFKNDCLEVWYRPGNHGGTSSQ